MILVAMTTFIDIQDQTGELQRIKVAASTPLDMSNDGWCDGNCSSSWRLRLDDTVPEPGSVVAPRARVHHRLRQGMKPRVSPRRDVNLSSSCCILPQAYDQQGSGTSSLVKQPQRLARQPIFKAATM